METKESSVEESSVGAQGASLKLEGKDRYEISLEAMLKAGVHFGHKKSRWNPKMAPFIFGVRDGVHVLDLEKTQKMLKEAMDKVSSVVSQDGLVLLVGTKKQVKDMVKAVGEKAGIAYAGERWLGGTLTNFEAIRKRVNYLVENTEALEKKKLAHLTKLERTKLQKKLDKIDEKMGGLVPMKKLPDLVFVLDINKDSAAVAEAKRMGIETMGLIDSNSNPAAVDYPIPSNDDAVSALKYILGVLLKTVLGSKEKRAMNVSSERQKEGE